MNGKTLTVWVLVERGLIGTEKQCVAVAEALSPAPVIKRITLRQPWRFLSPFLNIGIRFGLGDKITPPWPDVLICGGRKSVGLALWIKRMSHGRVFTVCILDPKIHRAKFDLIAAPAHDGLKGANVIETIGAPNAITPARLEAAKAKWAPIFAHLPEKRVAVLIGGSSRTHTMTRASAQALATQLRALCDAGYGLLVTASRRTGHENEQILRNALTGTGSYIWDGRGDNPYEGFLALSDAIIVTSDSVSMTSEAASTGKPVYRFDLDGGSPRFEVFHALLEQRGIARPFSAYNDGPIPVWAYKPLSDTTQVASRIRADLNLGQE